jgi:hypothetical protein
MPRHRSEKSTGVRIREIGSIQQASFQKAFEKFPLRPEKSTLISAGSYEISALSFGLHVASRDQCQDHSLGRRGRTFLLVLRRFDGSVQHGHHPAVECLSNLRCPILLMPFGGCNAAPDSLCYLSGRLSFHEELLDPISFLSG